MPRWLLLSLWFCLSAAAPLRAEDSDEEFFEKQVRPILIAKCYACHSGTKTSGGLSLATKRGWEKGGESGAAIVPGKPKESLLIEAIEYRSLEMPPKDQGGKLSDAEIKTLTEWVAHGAFDPREEAATIGGMKLDEALKWWAFQPLLKTSAGALTSDAIDGSLDQKLAEASLSPNAEADKATLIRRATYDLTGLPPTEAEVKAFLADESPAAFQKLLDRLLESPQYGVHWGRHWLDVARYADTAGENTDRPLPHAWRYRNWVFDSLQNDLRFDEFVRLQLAGDLLMAKEPSPKRNEGIVATGYLAIARRFGHDIDKDVHLMNEDVIDNLGKNFLGLSLGCARCHDHKYDPITAKDYYALYGIFQSTRFAFPGCEAKGQPRDLPPLMTPAEIETLLAPWKQVEEERKQEIARREASPLRPRLKKMEEEQGVVLAESRVGEGEVKPLVSKEGAAIHVSMKAGEALQLTISPNGNYGADSTRIAWRIEGTDGKRWSVGDLVAELTTANPRKMEDEAAWCFIDTADGPRFLNAKNNAVEGHPELASWSLGDTPSVFVNHSAEPVQAWTKLPGASFFVHPGPNRPVAVTWVSPRDGEYAISGEVADAHPANLDGVSYVLKHLANAEYGRDLLELGKTESTPLPEPGKAPPIPLAYAVMDAKPQAARLHERGDPEKLGEEVPRRWIELFGGDVVPPEAGSGRAELANWVSGHPLLARVMVNRVWQWHFGQGLVRTPNDFGSRGEPPTHPELLEKLAAEFAASGYRLKPLHRLIMNTKAWKRSSERHAEALERDPENRLLARYSRRRLAAEEIRDSLLAASGQLDLSPGKEHPFPPELTWTFTQHGPFAANYETNRRSAFLMVQRQRQHPFLSLFDGADPNASTPRRQTTIAPPQALYFLNDPQFHALAAKVAARVAAEPEGARIARLFAILFQREPCPEERERAERFLNAPEGSEEEKWNALTRVLMASSEFIYVD